MILFKAELVPLIRTCRCGHDFTEHDMGMSGCCTECPCCDWRALKDQTRRFWMSVRAKPQSLQRANTNYYSWTGLTLRILRVWEEDPEGISEADAIAEGFSGRDAFLAYFHSINDKRQLDGRKPYAIEFRLVSVD